ncbi:MAG: 3-keto-disaccharide hydrolase [bacterium]|jgi:hypothetical protein
MKKVLVLSLLALALVLNVNAAQQKREIPVYGNYHGDFSEWESPIRAQVVADGGDNYHAVFYSPDENGVEKRYVINGKKQKNVTRFEGDVEVGGDYGTCHVSGEIVNGIFEGTVKFRDSQDTFRLERVELKPPTLGAEPPEGALVLLGMNPQENQKLLYENFTVQPRWVVHNDGSVSISGSSIISKQEYSDAKIHIEFMTPYMPYERGQARGNSGVYIIGRYELQVLDSFGEPPRDNEAGGFYQVAVPKVNAALPPQEWQTYDITFRAPKFENGQKTENARVTVVYNGITIHDDLVLPKNTPGGVSNQEAESGPLLLQDHSDQVRYRNVWIQKLDE